MKCKVAKGKSRATGKRSSNKHSLSALPFPPDCFSQKWTPSEEKRWIRNLTKHVFGDGEFFRTFYFALHDSLRSTGPKYADARSSSRTPHLHGDVKARRGDAFAIRRPGCLKDGRGMTSVGEDLLAGGGILTRVGFSLTQPEKGPEEEKRGEYSCQVA